VHAILLFENQAEKEKKILNQKQGNSISKKKKKGKEVKGE